MFTIPTERQIHKVMHTALTVAKARDNTQLTVKRLNVTTGYYCTHTTLDTPPLEN